MTTILSRLEEHARTRSASPAYLWKAGGEWKSASWAEYRDQVRQTGRALMALGLENGGRVGILGFNRPEWALAAFGSQIAGGAPAGIYQTSSPSQVAYILRHAGCRIAVVENALQLAKIEEARAENPQLEAVVVMDDPGAKASSDLEVLSWNDFLARAEDTPPAELERRHLGLESDQLATLIYTSGTTGRPKGVMLSHGNLWATAQIAAELAEFTTGDSMLSYLPLAHIAEQMLTLHVPVYGGYAVHYAEAPEKVVENLQEVQPTIVFGVPRVWERIYEAVSARLNATQGPKRWLFDWASGVGRRAAEVRNHGEEPKGLLALQESLADRLVQSKIREKLGLGRARFSISGAAPISTVVLEFFAGIGVLIHEIYGQSETCGPTTWNRPGQTRFGTVGPPLPRVEVRLAEDGEVMVRGPNVFQGYFEDPEATAETFVDGWLASGDVGQFDDEGFLSITGRKKEIFITSGGKNVAPSHIESELGQIEGVSEAVLIGDGRKFLSALLTLDPEALARLAREHDLEEDSLEGEDLHRHPRIVEEIGRGVDAVNAKLARVEQVRKFSLLPRPLSVEEGELTPTLKVRRKVVLERYAEEIEEMYGEG